VFSISSTTPSSDATPTLPILHPSQTFDTTTLRHSRTVNVSVRCSSRFSNYATAMNQQSYFRIRASVPCVPHNESKTIFSKRYSNFTNLDASVFLPSSRPKTTLTLSKTFVRHEPSTTHTLGTLITAKLLGYLECPSKLPTKHTQR
jgi:hypothetical protein